MAGGSFFNNADITERTRAQEERLFAGMNQMRQRINSGVDVLGASIGTVRSSADQFRQVIQPMGDALNLTARQLDRLNQRLASGMGAGGAALMGGAGVPAGGLTLSAFGMPVGVQGLRPGELQAMAPALIQQQTNIALANMGRNLLTQTLPTAVALGASFAPGGAVLGPLAGAATQFMAPQVLRRLGVDAALARFGMARDFQRGLAERMGGVNNVDRFGRAIAAGDRLAKETTDFIADEQRLYQSGIFNFGFDAAEYQQLATSAISTTGTRELKQILERGSGGLKTRLKSLIEVSATLNTTFDETAQLLEQFGQQDDGGQEFARMARDVNRLAGEAPGLNRQQLLQFQLAMRDRARLLGFADATAGHVTGMVADIQRAATADQPGISFERLATFGGNTEQERAQNMALAIQGMNEQLLGDSFGRTMRLGGGGRGGLLATLGRAGANMLNDPFALTFSEADPTANSQTAAGLLDQLIESTLEVSTPMLGRRGARAAVIEQLRGRGLSAPQAGAMLERYDFQNSRFQRLQQNRGIRGGFGEFMGQIRQYAAAGGLSEEEVLQRVEAGALKQEDIQSGVPLVGVAEKTSALYRTQGEIDRVVAADIQFMQAQNFERGMKSMEFEQDSSWWSRGKAILAMPIMGYGAVYNYAMSGLTPEQRAQVDSRRAKLEADARATARDDDARADVRASVLRNAALYKAAGIGFDEEGVVDLASLGNMRGESVMLSEAMTDVLRGLSSKASIFDVAKADKLSATERKLIARSLSASSTASEDLREFFGGLADDGIAENEVGQALNLLSKRIGAPEQAAAVRAVVANVLNQKMGSNFLLQDISTKLGGTLNVNVLSMPGQSSRG